MISQCNRQWTAQHIMKKWLAPAVVVDGTKYIMKNGQSLQRIFEQFCIPSIWKRQDIWHIKLFTNVTFWLLCISYTISSNNVLYIFHYDISLKEYLLYELSCPSVGWSVFGWKVVSYTSMLLSEHMLIKASL